MKKIFIIGLVAAELAMMAGTLPARFSPGMSIEPAMVDAKWARMMDRKADREAREAVARAGRRSAIAACIGPGAESMSTARYEKKEKACVARLASGGVAAQAEPVEAPREYYRPPAAPQYQAPAPAPPEPAGPVEAVITIPSGEVG